MTTFTINRIVSTSLLLAVLWLLTNYFEATFVAIGLYIAYELIWCARASRGNYLIERTGTG